MTDFHRLHFDSIQALRGLAALLVVLEHIRFLNCGAFGVDIFFCISGFMIMYTTHRDAEHFLLKRLIRIVPFYALMTLGTFFLLLLFPSMFEQTPANPVFLVKSLFFIPFDIGGGVLQPLYRIGWTINCEMFFYLLFCISMHISRRLRGVVCSLLMCIIVFAGSLLPNQPAPLTFYGSPVMLEFLLGILCYYAARRIYQLCYKLPSLRNQESPEGRPFATTLLPGVLCLLTAAILLMYMLLTKSTINVLGFYRIFFWGIPSMIIVLSFFTAGLFLRMPSWSVKLGNISFSLYLIHYYPILFADRKIFNFSTPTLPAVSGAIISTALVILLAWPAWYIMEKKVTGWLRTKVEKL